MQMHAMGGAGRATTARRDQHLLGQGDRLDEPLAGRAGPEGQVGVTIPVRAELLERLADLIVAVERPHPVRVAIDGRGGAGKSTLADALVAPIERRGRPVIRAEVDDFYRLEIDRRNRAGLTAEAFYAAYDYAALRRLLLDPLGPGGSRRYRRRWHDGWHEGVIDEPAWLAPDDAILLLDGVFLLRSELDRHWDARIFVDIDAELGMARGVERDLVFEPPATRDAGRERRIRVWRERYLPADDAYQRDVNPIALADAVVDNRDPASPRLLLRG
jgi:uridine kinase